MNLWQKVWDQIAVFSQLLTNSHHLKQFMLIQKPIQKSEINKL